MRGGVVMSACCITSYCIVQVPVIAAKVSLDHVPISESVSMARETDHS